MRYCFQLTNVLECLSDCSNTTAGAGVGIRINDDGVDSTHPEFAGRFDLNSSCTTYMPLFLNETSNHGTTCAAIAAGGADNNICSVGIAPNATLSGCRVVGDSPTAEVGASVVTSDSTFEFLYVNMENMDISSNSWGFTGCDPKEGVVRQRKRRRLQATCPFRDLGEDIQATPCRETSTCFGIDWARPTPSFECEQEIINYCRLDYIFEIDPEGCSEFFDLFVDCKYLPSEAESQGHIRAISEGRDGKGAIIVVAAGNSFAEGDRLAFMGPTHNTRLAIAVGAVGKDGYHTRYSTTGTAIFVSAPGGDFENYRNVVSVLAGGGCLDSGVGTSWAAPVVSGVLALVLEVNPDLTWRDVRGILASTSTFVNDVLDDSWVTNGAGFHHSDRYGFGIVNASAAVAAARIWEPFSPERIKVGQSGPCKYSEQYLP